MPANSLESETSLIDWAVEWLAERLPENWRLELQSESQVDLPQTDGRLLLHAAGGYQASIAVEARQTLAPREAQSLLPRLAQVLHSMTGKAPVLIVAPWLGPRTRELLREQDINYIDQTGNALIKLEHPAVYLETVGSDRNPTPRERGKAKLRGPKAGRLLRRLIDVRPPYTVNELSSTTGLAPGYVSRLIDALDEEALIERTPRGPVGDVNVAGLLRRWAKSYDVFKTNGLFTYIARPGWSNVLDKLASDPSLGSGVAITGSVAATRLSPVAAPAMLLAYTPEPERLAEKLNLLPADDGADVGLLLPFDPVVWAGASSEAGTTFVAPAQVAVDCLTGNGRMPAEGEAVLEWMTSNETQWRWNDLWNEVAWPK
jgi:hypothetical protein